MKYFLCLCFCIINTLLFSQTSLYVATNGNDNTGNGSIATPYQTIAKAASIAQNLVISNPNTPVDIWVRAGTYRNASFSTFAMLDSNSYDPVNSGEPIWKANTTAGTTVRLNNINGTANAWITIKPFTGEHVIIEGDGDIVFSIRNCTYIRVEGFEIKGVADRIPKLLAWKYWGTYRYLNGGSYVYGDRKTEICAASGITPCTDIPPAIFVTGNTYTGLPNINALNVERPSIFGGKGILVQLSNHIEVLNNEIHHFPGGGLRVTQSDYVVLSKNVVHHNSSRASVGTHGFVIEGLTEDSGDNSAIQKMLISENVVYSNYNDLYSWVQSKTICTTAIDEGKGICLLRTSPSLSSFNGIIRVENNIAFDNGKSGIHSNEVDNAEIINNTVYQNAHTNLYNASLSGGTNAGISIQSSNNIKIINNIAQVADGLTPALQALSEGQNCSGEIVSNNIVWGGTISDFIGGYTTANPLFTNIAANDVTLQASSPAISAGLASVAPTKDFLGNTRNNPPTIGAYEYLAPYAVEFTDFWLVKKPSQAHLYWITNFEQDNQRFEIERSSNGYNWAKIGVVLGNGTTSISQKYSFLDENPLQNQNYYRLKIVDINGNYTYSEVLSFVNYDKEYLVSPNPFSNILEVENVQIQDNIQLYDITGNRIFIFIQYENNTAKLYTDSLNSNCLYLLKINGKTKKIVKL